MDAAVEEMVGSREAGHASSNDDDSWHSDLSWTVSVLHTSTLECILTPRELLTAIEVSY